MLWWLWVLVLAAHTLAAVPVAAQNVLDAEPTVRVDSNEDATERSALPDVERAKSRIIIIRKGGQYLWASREGRELAYHASNAVHYFIAPSGAGYIKVFDTHFLPADQRPKGQRYLFMEHVTVMLHSITYWGSTDRFDLEPGR